MNRSDGLTKSSYDAVGVAFGLFLVVAVPFFVSTWLTIYQVRDVSRTQIDGVLVDPGDALQVIEFVNRESGVGELVIASPAIAWGLQTNTADFQLALASQGQKTVHFPDNIPKDRFAYETDLGQVRFLIVDRIWRNWAGPALEDVNEMIRQVERWPLAMQSGEISVYRNPENWGAKEGCDGCKMTKARGKPHCWTAAENR